MGKLISLTTLKAAIVLALNEVKASEAVRWWHGTVKDEDGPECVVMQVACNYVLQVRKILSGYGITDVNAVKGTGWDLLPIPVSYLEGWLPGKVTRQWDDIEGIHDEWKKSVVGQLDDLGVRYLNMSFSGSGDDSNPDEWECSRTGELRWQVGSSNLDGTKAFFWYRAQDYNLPKDLKEEISEYVWETLVQYDCVNNDGGGGSLTIDLREDAPVFLFSCYINEMVTHDHAVDEEV